MTEKEKFLKLDSYEEFDRRREEFKNLKFDKDILSHMAKIFPIKNSTKEELHRTPPLEQCKNCRNWQVFNGCSLYPGVLKEFPMKDKEEIPCQYCE